MGWWIRIFSRGGLSDPLAADFRGDLSAGSPVYRRHTDGVKIEVISVPACLGCVLACGAHRRQASQLGIAQLKMLRYSDAICALNAHLKSYSIVSIPKIVLPISEVPFDQRHFTDILIGQPLAFRRLNKGMERN
jgi:hypothetical protein